MCSFIWRHTMYYRRAGSNKKQQACFQRKEMKLIICICQLLGSFSCLPLAFHLV